MNPHFLAIEFVRNSNFDIQSLKNNIIIELLLKTFNLDISLLLNMPMKL